MIDLAPDLEQFGLCPFAQLSGKPCPFCGGTRAVVAMAAGNLPRAYESNLAVSILAVVTSVHFLSLLFKKKSIRVTFDAFRHHASQAATFGTVSAYVFWAYLLMMWTWNLFRW